MSHSITTESAAVRVQVRFNGEIIADTRNAVRLNESGYPAVYYIPRKDVKMERLVRTSYHSRCPYKGEASYYSIKDGAENAVWSYETPLDDVAAIKGHLAFYANRVDISVGGDGDR